MTINRLVIIPEFQGFGLGSKFINEIANLHNDKNRIRITSSLKPFISSLKNNIKWKCVRFGRVSSGSGSIHNKKNVNSFSYNRITATFEYVK